MDKPFFQYINANGEKMTINISRIEDIEHYADGSLLVSFSGDGGSRYIPAGKDADALNALILSMRIYPLT